jgi:hypothetical protein
MTLDARRATLAAAFGVALLDPRTRELDRCAMFARPQTP